MINTMKTHESKSQGVKESRGFTIVETLVAITILMIAIAGPLTVANQALHAAFDSRNQMIASNLAQETIEEVRNYKDNNITNNDLGSVFSGYYDPNNPNTKYIAYANPASSYTLDSCSNIGNPNCALYLSAQNGYSYSQSGNTSTSFYRWFTLSPVGSQTPPSEYLLTVTVQWVSNNVLNQIQIQDILSNTVR